MIITEEKKSSDKETEDFINSIPIEGSLGLLALGATGLMAWRHKRVISGIHFAQGNTSVFDEDKKSE